MAHLLGIDIGPSSVRTALIKTSYRKVAIEALREVSIADYPTTIEAIQAAAAPLKVRGESAAVDINGDATFLRKLELPATAAKQLAEVLPFELEAQLPFDLADCVFDSRLLPRAAANSPVSVLAVVARTDDVRARIELVKTAIGIDPERVDTGGLALANLANAAPELAVPGPVAIIHLDTRLTDVVVLKSGLPEFTRTVTGGVEGLPASAAVLARELRQTLSGWLSSGGEPPLAVYLTGPGASLNGAVDYLSGELGMPITPLPKLRIECADPALLEQSDQFAKTIALALSLAGKPRSLNLRTGSLAYERGFGFLREKIPMLAGLAAVIVASFGFSAWMEHRALTQQHGILEDTLAAVTTDVIGEAIRDPATAQDRVGVSRAGMDDPMPYMDGFDIMVQLSKVVPPDVTHDVEELDFQKEHVAIHGIVPTIPAAQAIADGLKSVPCFKNVKIARTNQVVNENRQKYVLEFDVKCPTEDTDKTKKSGASGEGSAEPAVPEVKP